MFFGNTQLSSVSLKSPLYLDAKENSYWLLSMF